MPISWHAAPQALLHAALLVLGLVLAAVPLALWVVWSEILFLGVVAVFCVALPLYLALAWLEPPVATGRPAPRPRISPAFIDQTQRLHPMVHHHFRHGTAQFNRAMARLRTLMGPDA